MRSNSNGVQARRCVFALIATLTMVQGSAFLDSAKGGAAAQSPAATIGAEVINAETLDELAGGRLQALRAQEYALKRAALDQEIARIVLEKEAKARGITVADLTKAEIDDRVVPPTEEETRAAYERDKDRFKGVAFDHVTSQVSAQLRRDRTATRRVAFLKDLRAKAGVKVYLEPVRAEITASGRSLGPNNAPVTIVEFSDFQCPYCARVRGDLERIRQRYPGKVRLVFRDFPLAMHKDARKAAEAGRCADEQGKFWEMHDRLFESQGRLKPVDLNQKATEIGLDAQAFGACLDSGRKGAEIDTDRAEGAQYGVSGTPTFFVNGRYLGGSQSFESFAQVIDEELERQRP